MNRSAEDILRGIYNYRRVAEDLATAGQPSEEELVAVAQAGFEVVVNLALLDADYSLADEPGLVRSLGMAFEHVPVIWERPTAADLANFFQTMRRLQGRKIFLHCAANMRASVFLALYRVLELGWEVDKAMAQVYDIWEPNEVWREFMGQALTGAIPPSRPCSRP